VNAALDALVGLAGAVPAHQLDLQVVQRVDVGKAVADGALQGGVAGQALLFPGDQRQRLGGAVPFGSIRPKIFLRRRASPTNSE